jgi:hypothetical protein
MNRKLGSKSQALVREILERAAGKWTLLVFDVLAHGELRFPRVGQLVGYPLRPVALVIEWFVQQMQVRLAIVWQVNRT